MASDEYRYCLKIETDTMVASTVHSLVLYDLTRDKVWSFHDHGGSDTIAVGIEIALLADELIVHSDYSVKTLERLYGATFDRGKLIDTLVITQAMRGKGGNGIADCATRLKIARDPFKGAEHWSPAVQRHAERDAMIIARIYDNLLDGIA